ncbi:hypothetical protein ACHAWF_011684, partial [Thalassiosira exigua]
MASHVTPRENDVLFGRGSDISCHPGNWHLRSITQGRKVAFLAARKKDKRDIARRIVDEIGKTDPPGRFLIEDPARDHTPNKIHGRSWLPVETEKAVNKVMHLLREREKPSKNGSEQGVPISKARSADPGPSDFPLPQPSSSGDLTAKAQTMQQSMNGDSDILDRFSPLTADRNGTKHGEKAPPSRQQSKPSPGLNCERNGNSNHGAGVRPIVGSLLGSPMRAPALLDNRLHPNQHVDDEQRTAQQAGVQEAVEREFGSHAAGTSEKRWAKKMSKQQFISRLIDRKHSMLQAGPCTNMGNAPESHSDGSPTMTEQNGLPNASMEGARESHSEGHPALSERQFGPLSNQLNAEARSQTAGDGSPMLQSIIEGSIENRTDLGTQRQHERKVMPGAKYPSTPLIDRFLSEERASHQSKRVSDYEGKDEGFNASHDPVPDYSTLDQRKHATESSLIDHFVSAERTSQEDEGSDALKDSVSDDPTLDQRERPAESWHRLQRVTLRQWIDGSKQRLGNGRLAAGNLPYVKSATLLALKLTQFLLEMEDGTMPVPLASITSENVVVFVKSENINDNAEAIGRVEITRCTGENPARGGNMPRLFALGGILYEVFSQRPFLGRGSSNHSRPSNSASVGGLILTDETIENLDHRPSKRSQRKLSQSEEDGMRGEYLKQLEMLGIPQPLRALICNLLDCSNGDFCGDDAYHSLDDVRTDLKLMRDDPARFLQDLPLGANLSLDIRPKFYGRESDISKIENAYRRNMSRNCGGILVSGGAGVGKSSLVASVTRKLALGTNRYFLEAKFDQNKNINPLNTIGGVFNALCDLFAKDATSSQLMEVAKSLEAALGSQAGILVGILPSLAKLTSCPTIDTPIECIDAAASMQFLVGKLLEVLSDQKGVTILLDDLQWADPASLMLIMSMISNTKDSGNVFFACCYRDDDMKEGDPFSSWLASINMFLLEMHRLENISKEGVNELVSETLHLFPRLTRPLATILHHKTRGNPLFLRQMLGSLKDQGCINLSVSPLRWTWDMDKIMNIEISDDVLALMIIEMRRLSADVQLGLKVASCLGSLVKYAVIDILSQSLGVNLRVFLDQAVQKGFMVKVDESCIRFSHDKIQQAAYEMMP